MSKFNKLVQGNVLSETAFYKVEKVVGDKVQLQMDNGESVVLDKGYVDSFLTSADQFEKTEKVTRTEMAEILLSHPRTAVSVSFNKQVESASVVTEIQEAYSNTAPKDLSAILKKVVAKALVGEERLIIGRHYGGQDEYGRLPFVDMGIEKDFSKNYENRLRKVDTRTLNWIIVDNTKYIVK